MNYLQKLFYSRKFILGIIFIIGSLIIGKITTFTFIRYIQEPFIRWISLTIYLLSWPPFIIGVWWVGKEYADNIRKYFGYKYYHQSIKVKTKKAIKKGKEGSKQFIEKGKQGSKQFIEKGKKGSKQIKNRYNETKSKVSNRFNNSKKNI